MSSYDPRPPKQRNSFDTSNFSAVAVVLVALVIAGVLIGGLFILQSNDKPMTLQERQMKNTQELKKQDSEQDFLVEVLKECKMFKGEEKKMDCIEKFVDDQT